MSEPKGSRNVEKKGCGFPSSTLRVNADAFTNPVAHPNFS